ncbi:MAG TPA: hypothetical protein VGG67_00665 [Steroidobacteraceae bacterium]
MMQVTGARRMAGEESQRQLPKVVFADQALYHWKLQREGFRKTFPKIVAVNSEAQLRGDAIGSDPRRRRLRGIAKQSGRETHLQLRQRQH